MEIIYSVSFYIMALLTVLSAFGAVFCSTALYSVVSLFVSVVMTGFLLISLGFSYLGAVQIVLGAVGTTILLMFSKIFIPKSKEKKSGNIINAILTATAVIILILSIFLLCKNGFSENLFSNSIIPLTVSDNKFSENLYINYGASFIFSSLVFLSAVLGFGVILADKDVKGESE